MARRHLGFGILALVMTLVAGPAAAVPPTFEGVRTTDVTSAAFAVDGRASEPAAPGLRIFADPDGAVEITQNLEVTPFPLQGGDPDAAEPYTARQARAELAGAARALGILRLGVQGCAPGTTYYYQLTATNGGGETGVWPATGLQAVTLPAESAFVPEAVQLAVSVTDAGAPAPAGWLVAVSSPETSFPVTALVGDGAAAGTAVLNLSRLRGADGLNWTPIGTKTLGLEVWGPAEGPLHQTVEVSFSGDFRVARAVPVNAASAPANQAPVLAAIGAKSGAEGAELSFAVTASDPDGTAPTLSATGLPSGASFAAGTFTWTPGFDQAGAYEVTFIASDGTLTDTEVVAVTVADTNRPPLLVAIGAKSVAEGEELSFTVTASDPDGTAPILSATGLPTGATFSGGTFTWTPGFDQAGSHAVTFVASDGILMDSEAVTITVADTNRPPVLVAIGAKSVAEGAALGFTVSASDPDGTAPTLSATGLPTGASVTAGTFSWTPDFDQAGSHTVTFTASDGSLTDSEVVTITVTNTNRVPLLAAIGAKSVAEGVRLSFTVTASDPDNTTPTLSATGLPTGASFTAGTFSWTPDYAQAGTYTVTFTAADGTLTASEAVEITVTGVNRPPVLAAIGAQSIAEGATLTFAVTASDPDGPTPTLSATGLPDGATFSGGTFSWTPDYTQAGSHTVTFTASDGTLSDSETVTITVADSNRAPVADAGPDQTVAQGALVALDGTNATDPDGGFLTYLWTQEGGPVVPLDAPQSPQPSFTAPNVGADGAVLSFRLTVTDAGALSHADTVLVNVLGASGNRPPVADAGPDQAVAPGVAVTLSGVNSSDPDGDPLVYQWQQVAGPSVALSNPTGQTVTFTAPAAAASLTFELTASDGAGLSATDTVVVSVVEGNQPPVASAGPDQTVAAGAEVTLDGSNSSDAEGPLAAYRWRQLSGTPVTLSDPTAAVTTFQTPNTGGVTLVFELTVTDAASLSRTDTLSVNVTGASGNLPPVADAGADQTVPTGATVRLDGSGSSDPEGAALTFRWTQPSGPAVTLSDVLSPTPSFTAPGEAAALGFELRVTDAEGASSTDAVTINVSSQNLPPVADAGPDQEVEEGDTVTLDGGSSSDPEGGTFTCQWAQEDGPGVTLADAGACATTLVAPAVDGAEATLAFRLTVRDAQALEASEPVSVRVQENGITGFPAGVITFHTTTGRVLGIAAGEGAQLVALYAVDPATLTNASHRPAELPYGLVDFHLKLTTPGDTATVTVYLPAAPGSDDEWYLYGDAAGWSSFAAQAAFDGQGRWVRLTLNDGGDGDEDGQADGRLRHRSALGLLAPQVEPAPSGGGGGGGGCFLRALGL